jgi:hypothetical protein
MLAGLHEAQKTGSLHADRMRECFLRHQRLTPQYRETLARNFYRP